MTQDQLQKLKKYIAFRDLVNNDPLILDNYPHLKPSVQLFLEQLQYILNTSVTMETKESTFISFAKAREELIDSIIFVSRKITAYSLLEEITDIQGVFCYSKDELIISDNEKLITYARALRDYIKLQKIDLDCFGIEQPSLDILINAIEYFNMCMDNVLLDNQIVKYQTVNQSELFTVIDAVFESKLVDLPQPISAKPL